jgi:outer membrane cobalamin receptor
MLSTVCDYLLNRIDFKGQSFNQFCGCCMLCFSPFTSFTQIDTTQFEEITVIGNHPKVEEYKRYSREEITELSPADLGILLKRVAGASVSDYGGVGSMKTLSIRGLGSTHTGILVNGFPNSNPQNGQVDFGRIQLENVESVTVELGPTSKINIPVSSQMKGNTVSLKTFEQSFSKKPFTLRSSAIIGSFGRKELNSSIKLGTNNSFLSFSGNLRSYEGDFQYSLPFDIENSLRQRSNNNMESYSLSLGAGKKWKSKRGIYHRARLFGNVNHIDRSLPGAIILYSAPSDEKLLTQTKQFGGDYSMFSDRFKMRSYLNVSGDQLRYQDPAYFNNDGFIDNHYQNRSVQSGFNTHLSISKIDLLVGNDVKLDALSSSRELGHPFRFSNIGMVGANIDFNYFNISPSLFHHFINDQNLNINHAKYYQRWNPQLALTSSQKLFNNLQLSIWYKHSSRAPSFNELYYSQIGNTSLSPEESQQTNVGYVWVWNKKKVSGSISGNLFYNRLTNKIVALPTQNLFVWSIQNVGSVHSYGKDVTIDLAFKITKNLSVDLSSTTTYQSVSDRSSKDSPSYGHQIANTPNWTNASDIQFKWRQWNLGVSSLYMGKRHALNENITANELDSYLVFDTQFSYRLELNNSQQLLFQAGIKNVMNSQYYHINYFVMPGRNYFLKIAYEI